MGLPMCHQLAADQRSPTHLVKVKHEVQFTDILKVPVQRFHKNLSGALVSRIQSCAQCQGQQHSTDLYQVEYAEFAFRTVDDEDKVQGRIVSVHDAPSLVRVVIGAKKCL